MAAKKRVVVVGGGVAGSYIAKLLQAELDVTLLDPKDYYELVYAQLRMIVEPTFADRAVVLHTDYLKEGTLVIDSARSFSDAEIVTVSGERLLYDFLVITTGSEFHGPVTRVERLNQIDADNKRLLAAESVLIIGGGPVGVELAAEIAVDFPTKKVTIVHTGARLMEFLESSVSKKALQWLEARDVEVILEDRIENLENLTAPEYTTMKGISIKTDTHFVCTGKKLGNMWLQETTFKNVLDEEGRLKVDQQLRVEGFKNVFAAGDITNLKEIKQGFLAHKHADIVASNIKKLSKDPSDSKLAIYQPLGTPIGIVSLGRKDAVAQLPLVGTIIGWLPGLLKSKDLFVGKSRRQLGLMA